LVLSVALSSAARPINQTWQRSCFLSSVRRAPTSPQCFASLAPAGST
jgi:hypothetical protein